MKHFLTNVLCAVIFALGLTFSTQLATAQGAPTITGIQWDASVSANAKKYVLRGFLLQNNVTTVSGLATTDTNLTTAQLEAAVGPYVYRFIRRDARQWYATQAVNAAQTQSFTNTDAQIPADPVP